MAFIHDDFLLSTDAARRLYHENAVGQPIYDYHCHLPPEDLASNRRFNNLAELWLVVLGCLVLAYLDMQLALG